MSRTGRLAGLGAILTDGETKVPAGSARRMRVRKERASGFGEAKKQIVLDHLALPGPRRTPLRFRVKFVNVVNFAARFPGGDALLKTMGFCPRSE